MAVTLKMIGKLPLINCSLKLLPQVESTSSKIFVKPYSTKSLIWTLADENFFEAFLQNFRWKLAFSKNLGLIPSWKCLANILAQNVAQNHYCNFYHLTKSGGVNNQFTTAKILVVLHNTTRKHISDSLLILLIRL